MMAKKEAAVVDYSASPSTEVMEAHATLLGLRKATGQGWVKEAALLLIDVKVEGKAVEEKKEEKTRFTRIKLNEDSRPFNTVLKILERIEKALKDRMLVEYEGADTIVVPEEGEIAFRERWVHEVSEWKDVPREYYSIDAGKIQTAIDNGMRNIPGVKVFKARTVVVTPKPKPEP
jgi:hypothetical protein